MFKACFSKVIRKWAGSATKALTSKPSGGRGTLSVQGWTGKPFKENHLKREILKDGPVDSVKDTFVF